MLWKKWKKLYQEIEKDFGFSYEREIRARDYLSKLLGDRFIRENEIKKFIGNEVYIIGFSPTLEKEIELIPKNARIIAADDAAVVLHQNDIEPDIILTDLDGELDSLIKIRNAIFGIHAHGDNIDLLPYVDFFNKRFGTTQIEPIWNVYDFGGFTDGDRGVFLAHHFGAKIHIIGFDFNTPRVKENKDAEIKRKKLRWASFLISYLQKEGANIVWENLNSQESWENE